VGKSTAFSLKKMSARGTAAQVKQINAALFRLGTTELINIYHQVSTDALEPVREGLLSKFSAHRGENDYEKPPKSGRLHRWKFKFSKLPGHTVGFTRAMVANAFKVKGFGFKIGTFHDKPYARIKAWAPGIWIVDGGRYRGQNTYQGWNVIMSLFANSKSQIQNYIRTNMPIAIKKRAAELGL